MKRKHDEAVRYRSSDLAYINNWLLAPPPMSHGDYPRFRLRNYVWECPAAGSTDDPGMGFAPGSQNADDMREAIEAIHVNEATDLLGMRLENLVSELAGSGRLTKEERGGVSPFDVVVIDTSPTLLGTSRVAYRLHEFAAKSQANTLAVHVMGPDAPSLCKCVRAVQDPRKHKGTRDAGAGPARTAYVVNMLPTWFRTREYSFADREGRMEHVSRRLAEGGLGPPGDDEWFFVPWSEEVVRAAIEPGGPVHLQVLENDTGVRDEIGELVVRGLRWGR